jgi:ABC-2 type transport system ATP-binding protein
VVSLSLDGAAATAAESALTGLAGLERTVVVDPDALAVYVEDGAGSVAEIVRLLDRHGIGTAGIAVARPSLDDVFLQATGRRLEGQDQATDQQETSR